MPLFAQEGILIEIKIPKEISDYQETVFFGLTMRQFICSLLAVGAAVGLYFLLYRRAGTELAGWASILGAAPFALCGFVRYHGMSAEQLLMAILRSELFTPRKLVFKSDSLYFSVLKAKIDSGQRKPRRETEVTG